MGKKNILWIARYAPYDNVKHAGGQNCNYYLKSIHKTKRYNIKLITFCEKSELNDVENDYNKYGIDYYLGCAERDNSALKNKVLNIEERFSPLNRYANFCDLYTAKKCISYLKKNAREGYRPNVIILQWTQVILLWKEIRKIFPYCRIIGIEEDVAFLGRERKLHLMKNNIKRLLFKIKLNRLNDKELEALRSIDGVYTTNTKDSNLLKVNNINSNCISPYFKNMINIKRDYNGNKDIIFYGAMNREENYLSAIWFINHCMPLLENDYNFIVIGNKPHDMLKKYESDRIKIIGYVDSIAPYFKNSLCVVAPLQLGAGIKLKVVEAMSAGIPIMTNEIGIEGIPAIDDESYFYCETPEQYVTKIKSLYEESDYLMPKIEKAEKSLIENHFDYLKSVNELINKINID